MPKNDLENYRKRSLKALDDPISAPAKEEDDDEGGSGSGDMTPLSVYEEKGKLCRHQQEEFLKKFASVIAQDRQKPEGDHGNPLAAHPILTQYQIFDGADPKVAVLPSANEDAALNYLEYQLEYQARKELGNAKRRKFNPSPGPGR